MEFEVNANNVILKQIDQVESGEYNITECNFVFSNEYDGLTKIAVFTGENGDTYKITILNNKCEIPSELLTTSQIVQIGVYAYEVQGTEFVLRYSPMPTRFMIEKGSYVVNAVNMSRPTPTEVEQLQSQITHNANDIEDLQQNVSENTTAIENLQNDVGDIQTEQTEQNTKIQKNTDDIVDINQSIGAINTDIGEINQDINNLETNKADKSQLSVYSLITETGSQIELNINTTNYKMKSILKDKNGNVIFTSNEIDLPLESFVVSATYDNTTKEIVLTLQNGQTIRFSVTDLVSGLVSEDDLQTILASYYTKTETNTLLNDKVDKEQGKGLSTNDFTDNYKNQIETNQTAITNIKDGTTIDSFGDVETALNAKEDVANKVTSLSSTSTDVEYPSAKSVYDELEAKQDEIDSLEQDVEDLRGACLSVEGTGTDITLNNTAQARLLKNELNGRTEQEQLTGKNLFDISNVTFDLPGSSVIDSNIIKNTMGLYNQEIKVITSRIFTAGTYTISGKVYIGDVNPEKQYAVGFYGNFKYKVVQSYNSWEEFSVTITIDANKDGLVFQGIGNATNYLNLNTQFKDIQVEQGSTATSYEPYTNGLATPNPNYIEPIKNVTGNANVKIQNKNLFVAQKIVNDSNDSSVYIDNDGNIYFRTHSSLKIKPSVLKENTSYTFKLLVHSNNSNTNIIQFKIKYTDGTISTGATAQSTNDTSLKNLVFSTNPAKTIDYIYEEFTNNQPSTLVVDGSMILEGLYTAETMPSYVPHQEQNYPFTFAEGQRAMQGTQLLDDGIYNKRKQIVLNGTENWTEYSQGTAFQYTYYLNISNAKKTMQSSMCSHFRNVNFTWEENIGKIGQYSDNTNGAKYFNTDKATLEEWKDWLAEQYANGTPVILEFDLEEEEIIPYNETQQAQYDAIKEATSYDDITYITSESDELGFNMNVVAVADANKVIDSELQEIKNAITVLGGELNV